MYRRIVGLALAMPFGIACAMMLLTMALPVPAHSQEVRGKALIGRWDITVDRDGTPAPSWLEVKLSGFETLVGSYVSTEGSARPVSEVVFNDGTFSFRIPKQWEQGNNDLVVSGALAGERIEGTVTTPEGKTYRWKGVRAPELKRSGEPVWGDPIALFNGRDLTGWQATGENQWQVKDGILINPRAGANLISERKFEDFKLHLEFRYPKGSNSGVYLRGRHEVQIMDTSPDEHPSSVLYGGVYGFLTPSEIAAKDPGEWQTFDITLVGRMVTIVANGKTVICNQEIPGITGGALDSNEGEPGPIYIQGDHGPVEFRKVIITPAR
ncbi:protein of unknown function [Parapedobacter composti]|uniref:3-keto-alpha-glucoside-1,2-lyase/3-keto-2-hydroxy-glucal hydratase domain-containing protein n=2 Tax=Parapedobacter composti TaxID=623281 RepID=A0A1I1F2A7_9SPHI|nr:protein of unknown function [Parapedobacter composti]